MQRPFELTEKQLHSRLDEMVDATFSDLQSQFLVLPKGNGFVEFSDFQHAYEVLKRNTSAFNAFTEKSVWQALDEDALVLVVLRTILGLSPPEWAAIAKSDLNADIDQNALRVLDSKVRKERGFFAKQKLKRESLSIKRTEDLVKVAVAYVKRGAPAGSEDTVHRLGKFDTSEGLISLKHAAQAHVPYAVLLYERYLGRPFASHRDAVSGLVGKIMENAIEERLERAQITYRQTGRAERIPGFDQAPDFIIPTEVSPAVVIEAKIVGDDGTARDKVARILRLANMRDDRFRAGKPPFQLVACVDGRGFGIRRQDMKDMLKATKGKIFTLSTLDHLILNTELKNFLPKGDR
jgi:RNase P/RNase MRP subunit POP5